MWVLLALTGFLLLMVASATKQLATSIFGRVGARLFYVLMWACFLGAGIDIVRVYNLDAPLLFMCGVLMFYTVWWLLKPEQLQRIVGDRTLVLCVIGCLVAGVSLFFAAFVEFMMWVMMKSRIPLILLAALLTSACSGNDDSPFWVLVLFIGVGGGLLVWLRRYSEVPAKPLTSEETDEDDEFICDGCDDEVDELTTCAKECGIAYCSSCAPHMLNDAGLCADCGDEEVITCSDCGGETIASKLVGGLCAECHQEVTS